MKPAPFDYARPDSLDEALALVAEHGDEAMLLAGGQSLVPMLALRLTAPAMLVDINRIPELDGCAFDAPTWRLGGRVRHAELLKAVAGRAPDHVLARALPHVAHPAIRNRGTLGGSLALADPAAELPACLVCLDAEIELASTGGTRRLAADGFFEGVYATARRPDEIVTAVHVPAPAPSTRFAFHEVARRHGDYAIVGLAARMDASGDGIAAARLVVFGAGERPQRLTAAEETVAGRQLDAGTRRLAVEAARDTVEIAPDPLYGETYKRHLAGVLVGRALDDLGAAR